MDPASVRSSAESCLAHFNDLHKLQSQNSWVDDQKASFNLWASDLGVFAASRASADRRLRDYPVIRQVIIQILESLGANLAHCMV